MNITTSKRLSLVVPGFVLLSLGLALYGYEEKVAPPRSSRNIPEKEPHLSPKLGASVEVWVDDYIAKQDPPVYISARKQHALVWRCRKCEFRIVKVEPDPKYDNPQSVKEKFHDGPFYRKFPDNEWPESEYFKAISAGPVHPFAASKKPERHYQFKATIRVKGLPKDIDPHIMTLQGLNPD